MTIWRLPLRNLISRPGRTAALVLLSAFLAFAVFGGSLVVGGLQSGLTSLEQRLGADIVVVPTSAASKSDLKNMLLQGTTGYFYMPAENVEKLRGVEGVEAAAPQLFLASLRADCCSVAVQVIGFDEKEDFTVTPWMREVYRGELTPGQVIVGSQVNCKVGDSIRIYGENCPVAARLQTTGTGLDTAVYASMETVYGLLDAARSLGHDLKISGDPASLVSAVYLNVANGYDVDEVANWINLHMRKVKAVRTKSMMVEVGDGLGAVARIVGALAAACWALGFIILTVAFGMMAAERRREFAALRVMGMTRGMLARTVLAESALIGLAGAALGIALAALVLVPFGTLIEARLGLPYLLPSLARCAALALATSLAVVAAACLSSAWSARRCARVDTATILREGR